MSPHFKFVIFLALALAAGFYGWSADLENIQSLSREVFGRGLSDPLAAEAINEELDYFVAKRKGSLEGWQAFLAAHESGSHARLAKTEVETLLLAKKATPPDTVRVSKGAAPDPTPRSGAASAPATAEVQKDVAPPASPASEDLSPPSQGTEDASLSPDEICKRDADWLAQLRGAYSIEEAMRFAEEARCAALLPQLRALIELRSAVPAPVTAKVQKGVASE